MRLKGYKTYLVFGFSLASCLALLAWCHFEPGLFSPFIQGLLEGAAAASLVGLGLRKITSGPAGPVLP